MNVPVILEEEHPPGLLGVELQQSAIDAGTGDRSQQVVGPGVELISRGSDTGDAEPGRETDDAPAVGLERHVHGVADNFDPDLPRMVSLNLVQGVRVHVVVVGIVQWREGVVGNGSPPADVDGGYSRLLPFGIHSRDAGSREEFGPGDGAPAAALHVEVRQRGLVVPNLVVLAETEVEGVDGGGAESVRPPQLVVFAVQVLILPEPDEGCRAASRLRLQELAVLVGEAEGDGVTVGKVAIVTNRVLVLVANPIRTGNVVPRESRSRWIGEELVDELRLLRDPVVWNDVVGERLPQAGRGIQGGRVVDATLVVAVVHAVGARRQQAREVAVPYCRRGHTDGNGQTSSRPLAFVVEEEEIVLRARNMAAERASELTPESSRSSITSAPPAAATAAALWRWWSCVACGNGTRTAGRPAAASSASVVAPARQTTRSAAAISRSMSSMNGSTRAGRPAAR